MIARPLSRRLPSANQAFGTKVLLRNGSGLLSFEDIQSSRHPFRRWQSQDDRISHTPSHARKPRETHPEAPITADPQSYQGFPANDRPKARKTGRTLVLCFDGTSNHFKDDKNTNVVLLFGMLERNKPEKQLVYYQTGIGTYTTPGFISGISQKIAQLMDEAFAWYLQDHVMGGYKFLMDTYQEGDKICLFGFSRGAYTARALAAMLYRVGLLPPRNAEQVPFAYTIFKEASEEIKIWKKDRNDPRGSLSSNFRRTFSRKVDIELVGIWDTVCSVGFIPHALPNTRTNRIVKHVRHALALDERRARFEASYWNPGPTSQDVIGEEKKNGQRGLKDSERTVEEVWFAGGHGDVGGGWQGLRQESQLSRIPLRWMIREAKKCTDAIVWDENALRAFHVNKPDSSDVQGLAKYIEQERQDALSKFHSAFTECSHRFFWRLLEVMPLLTPVNMWGYDLNWFRRPHWFRAREIREPTPDRPTKVHSSVKTRLKHLPGGYVNAAKWDPQKTEFVDEWAIPKDAK